MRDGDDLTVDLPAPVAHVLDTIAAAGHEAVLVGGCVRDLLLGDRPLDWDAATSAPPETVAGLFPGSVWRNRFGTVTVRSPGDQPAIEVTTYRLEGPYADRRRPDEVRWGTSLEEDLARRDFTINAVAWRPAAGRGGGERGGRLVDPHGGAGDLAERSLRAVGDAGQRIAEDALRMLRAVRFAARFGMAMEPATADAIRSSAGAAAGLSGERMRDELLRLLSLPAPSEALGQFEALGLLAVVLPEVAALRGIPQAKALPGDALDHSLRTVDALPAGDPELRLAGLLHDLGKATTLADGHFIGHEREGARLAARLLRRLRMPGRQADRIVRLVRQHMFAYTPEWTDAAVRRFVGRVGPDLLDDLFALRAADNAASGAWQPAGGGIDELRRRVALALANDPLAPAQLAVDGDDLVAELGIEPGPTVGALLRDLMDAVLDDPALNKRDALLGRARRRLAEGPIGAWRHHEPSRPGEASE